jgi:hypothetical protein
LKERLSPRRKPFRVLNKPRPANVAKSKTIKKGKSRNTKKGKAKTKLPDDDMAEAADDALGNDVEDEVIAAAAEDLLIDVRKQISPIHQV